MKNHLISFQHYIFGSLLILLLLFFLPNFGFADTSYRLGVALGLSGTGAPYCKEAVEGLEIAVNEINSRQGFRGRQSIRLLIRDTQTNPETAKKVVTDLVEKEKIHALIGTYSSACALAVKPVLRENRVLHIAPISNSEDITKIDPSEYTFSVVPNTYMMSKAVVMGITALAAEKGWKKYVTIASDYAWGRSSQQIQIDLLREKAPQIALLTSYWPRLGQTRFNSFIVDMLAQKPDFVLSSIAGADNAFWLRDARDYRLFKKVANPGGLVSVTELVTQASSIRRGLYGRCRAPFFAHMDNAAMVGFVNTYRTKLGRFPSDWAVLLYDAVHILRQGVEKAGSIDAETVKAAMKGMTVETTRGRFTFRRIDNQLNCYAYFGRVADDPAYPFPIYHDLQVFDGEKIWRSEEQINAARGK